MGQWPRIGRGQLPTGPACESASTAAGGRRKAYSPLPARACVAACTIAVWLVGIVPSMVQADTMRRLMVEGRERSYLLHLPTNSQCGSALPVVLVFHAAAADARIARHFSGINQKADEAGFIAVYPNGTGTYPLLTWNAGGRMGPLVQSQVDDVAFVRAVLDDLAACFPIDEQRIFATGISNGGMMCYRLAAELSERIAAIAPIAGTMAVANFQPLRPVSVMHFHGTEDYVVPYAGPGCLTPRNLQFDSVAKTVESWRQLNGCPYPPAICRFANRALDGTTATRIAYGPGLEGTEVILVRIEGGGHAWPGTRSPLNLIGKCSRDISANDLMWEFFCRHPRGSQAPLHQQAIRPCGPIAD
jgi:polyhydroxybutyrate depolymerase